MKVILIGLTSKKEDNFPDWYAQILTKAELIDYHDVSGCYVLRPNSYEIWEYIKNYLDNNFKTFGVRNCYFPLFITKDALQKEEEHLNDFSPEVAWVTKSGNTNLEKELAIRPTSETSMYPYFSKWLQSYRDLPIKLNQWNNVVRWEFKNPTPFLRSREFLWQEGHTAHMTKDEAEIQVFQSLELYKKFYKEVLCIEVIDGFKTIKEQFAGADYTTTVEAFIPETGRGIQAATSHLLGQNFSKMFDITYEHPETNNKEFVWQTSWGLTTRSIGTMVMIHSDNIGLVLPPYVAFCQVVVIPTGLNKKTPDETKEKLKQHCKDIADFLNLKKIRAQADLRDSYTPPWKYNYWEMRGVPIRIEIGPRELESKLCTFANRVSGEKNTFEIADYDSLLNRVICYMDEISGLLYQNSKDKLENNMVLSLEWDDFLKNISNKKMIGIPFCGTKECENDIKQQLSDLGEEYQGCKSLCVPLNQVWNVDSKCINKKCNENCKNYTLFGKSY